MAFFVNISQYFSTKKIFFFHLSTLFLAGCGRVLEHVLRLVICRRVQQIVSASRGRGTWGRGTSAPPTIRS
jgi:hypothetical protein